MPEDIDEIERSVETDRTLLAASLAQLTEAFSPERLSETLVREVESRGGATTSAALDIARANPAGAILLGLGVASLIAGPKRTGEDPPARPAQKEPRTSRQEPPNATAAQDNSGGPTAHELRQALMSGLASLPEPARQRVIEAREAAIEAREKVDAETAAAARRAGSFHQRYPLATGALAAGVGALVASLLPRTKTEDRLMGAERDALLQQAELVLRDELARATATGEAALRNGVAATQDAMRQ